jgi:hypothetical protein
MSRRDRTSVRTIGVWIAAAWLAATGCALLPVEGGLGACSGALLSPASEIGGQCLERMVQEGGAAADWIEREGKPDYFELSSSRVRLLYIERDQVVELSRSATGGIAAKTSAPIRASDHMRFRNEDKLRLGQTRVSRVPAPKAAAEEEPSEVRRARVGERSDDAANPARRDSPEP